jgi:hypothetical protein
VPASPGESRLESVKIDTKYWICMKLSSRGNKNGDLFPDLCRDFKILNLHSPEVHLSNV